MIHQKKKDSSKVNLTISFFVHAALVGALVFFAAKEGLLGKKLKQLTVTMVPKEKKPEPPKEKPEPKVEPPKPAETPKNNTPAPPKVETVATPPPANPGPAAAAPAVSAGSVPAFDFGDGAKEVQTISDGPNGIYRGYVEHSLRAHWNRDDSIDDSTFVAEVEISVDSRGRITGTKWLSLSGNARWDASVKAAVAQIKTLGKEPPKGFPPRFIVRFDVESFKSDAIQLSSSSN